jgi:hypothetical protein
MNIQLILASTYSTVTDARYRLNQLGDGYLITKTQSGRWQIVKVGA